MFPADLEDVVDEADEAEQDHGQGGDPDVGVAQVAPEEGGDERADDDQVNLSRIAFKLNRKDYGRLRQLIDVLNSV